MKFSLVFLFFTLFASTLFAQKGVDTIHFRKIYYQGSSGFAFPIGSTKNILSPKFSGSLGLDISLKNPAYFLMPTIYTMSFGYRQNILDDGYTYKMKNASTSFYTVFLGGGIRKQLSLLNVYSFVGPGVGMTVEPRAFVLDDRKEIDVHNKRRLNFTGQIGGGADYKFNGFFVGLQVGYHHQFNKIQDTKLNMFTVMVGLKSDITGFGDKVVDIMGLDGSISGKKE